MSAGRGSPRVPGFQGDLPDTSRISPAFPSSVAVTGVTNALYNYRYAPVRTTPFVLEQAAAPYEDDNGLDEFNIPLGAIRGSIRGVYTGEAAVGGRVGITLAFGQGANAIETQTVVDSDTLVFPSVSDPNEVIVPIYVQEMTFPSRTDDTPFRFRIPFWIPTVGDISDGTLGLDTPFVPVKIFVREAQVGVTPSSSSISEVLLTVENYGQAMPASRM